MKCIARLKNSTPKVKFGFGTNSFKLKILDYKDEVCLSPTSWVPQIQLQCGRKSAKAAFFAGYALAPLPLPLGVHFYFLKYIKVTKTNEEEKRREGC